MGISEHILLGAGLSFFLFEDSHVECLGWGNLRSIITNSFKTDQEDYEAYLQGRKKMVNLHPEKKPGESHQEEMTRRL